MLVSGAWWHTPFVTELGSQRQAELCGVKPSWSLYKFQNCQDYIKKSCLKPTTAIETTTTKIPKLKVPKPKTY